MVRRTLAANTPTDAIREARSTAAKVEEGCGSSDATTSRSSSCVTRSRHGRAGTASTLAPSTVELYLLRLDKHVLPALGTSTKASAVTSAHLRTMIDTFRTDKQSGSSVRGGVVATSALMRYAVRRGLIASNPVRQLERATVHPESERRSRATSTASRSTSFSTSWGTSSGRSSACCAFAGLRISETLALRWADVDLKGGMLNVPGTKTAGSAQPVPMTADLVRELNEAPPPRWA